MTLHIGIAAPIATEHVAEFLSCGITDMPKGYFGAPFTGVLIGQLLMQGCRVSAFTTDTSIDPQFGIVKASGKNFDFYICPERRRAWRFNKNKLGRAVDGFADERRMLAKAINTAKPDIIHAHWSYEFAMAAIDTGIPHLITCHDAPAVILRLNPYPYRAIRYLMARQVFRKGRHFSTVSDYMLAAIQHYTEIPITVIPNPLAGYVLAGGSVRKVPTTRKIGFISNGWDRRKNPKPALQAFAELHSKQPASELHVFGHGYGVGEAAEKWCRQQGLTAGVIFHGVMPHKQLIEQLNGLDLLLHTALEESFGVVIAEAMALGLPIVAGTHSGAVPWVVGFEDSGDGRCCAVLTDISDPAAIVLAIDEAFNQNYPLRSAAGYARARKIFAPRIVSETYMSLYRQLLPANCKMTT